MKFQAHYRRFLREGELMAVKQLSILAEEDIIEWSNDDWETPAHVAKMMADLIKPSERRILEPCAGSGQIIKAIDCAVCEEVVAIEVSRDRYLRGNKSSNSWCFWINSSFFDYSPESFDLVVTNPPFSKCVEFVAHSLKFLDRNNPQSRLLFLMPLDWNCTKRNAVTWKNLDAHIHHVYRYEGRIDYLDKNGKPQKGRKCCDAVFDIRLGKNGAVSTYLGEVNNSDRLSIPLCFPKDPPF